MAQVTNSVKYADSPTVYGTVGGQQYAFSNANDFLKLGGSFASVQNLNQPTPSLAKSAPIYGAAAPVAATPAAAQPATTPKSFSVPAPTSIPASSLQNNVSSSQLTSLIEGYKKTQDDNYNRLLDYYKAPISTEEQAAADSYRNITTQMDQTVLDTNNQIGAIGTQGILGSTANVQAADAERLANYKLSTLGIQQKNALMALQNAQATRQQKFEAAQVLYNAARNNLQDTMSIYKATAPENIGTQVNPNTGDVYVITKNPLTGATDVQLAGNVGAQKAFTSTDLKQGADGKWYFVGVTGDGQVEVKDIGVKGLTSSGNNNLNELLSPTEAAALGVPYGTTKGQAASLGITPGGGLDSLLPTEKDRAVFNQIVNQYSKSPLIAASDRTVILQNTANSVLQDPTNAAKQMSLAYGYIQALDTYQSAVREGELANVNTIDSKIGQLQNYVQQMTNGQQVRPEVAKQIAEAAKSLVGYISEGAQRKEQMFAAQAQINGIDKAWNAFRGGFTTNYDAEKKPLTPLNYSSANPIVNKNPYAEVEELTKQFPSATEEEILQVLKEEGYDFNPVGKTSASTTGMRTDRHNNPTAFTTDVAKVAGLKEGVDYVKGDPFSNGKYYTAKLLADPIDTTIKVIDKIGFYTSSGAPRWTYIESIPQAKNWKNLSYAQKKQVIAQMYKHEGGSALSNYFV